MQEQLMVKLIEYFMNTVKDKEREITNLHEELKRNEWDLNRMRTEIQALNSALQKANEENKVLQKRIDDITT